MALFPLLNQLILSAGLLLFYRLAARLHSPRPAFAVTLTLLLGFSLQSLALFVMADVLAAVLLLGALDRFLAAATRPQHYLTAGLFAGLSALAQSAALLVLPAAGLVVLLSRRPHLRSLYPYGGVGVFAALQLAWIAFKLVRFGTAGDLLVRYTQFLRFHLDSIPTYLFGFFSFWGLAGGLLLAAGGVLALRKVREDRLLVLALLATFAAFFVLVYDYHAKRFLLYALWPGALLIAEALAALPRRAFYPAAGLLLLGAAVPLPAPGYDATWIALGPGLYLHGEVSAAASGSTRLLPESVHLVRRPLPPSVYQELSGLPGFPNDRRSFRGFTGDESAVYLYAEGTEPGARYRTVTRLGNLLRKRVKFIPRSYLEPYRDLLAVEPLPALGGYALSRVRLPGDPRSWVLATSAEAPFASAPGNPAVPADARRRAEEIDGFLHGSDTYTALVPSADPRADLAQLYLPFYLRSTETYVLAPGPAAALLQDAPVSAERKIGLATVRRTTVFGRPSAAISFQP